MNDVPLITLSRFKAAAKKGEPVKRVALRKGVVGVEAGEDRTIKFTISTGAVDRDNDTVAVSGWDLKAFMENPVVLWSHKAEDIPIGKCTSIGIEGDALKAVVEFQPPDMPDGVGEKAEATLRSLRTGFLSAVSVGFRPTKFEIANDRNDADSWFPGLDFLEQELMEFSVCSIPANAEALIDPSERVLPTPAVQQAAVVEEVKATGAPLRAARLRAFA